MDVDDDELSSAKSKCRLFVHKGTGGLNYLHNDFMKRSGLWASRGVKAPRLFPSTCNSTTGETYERKCIEDHFATELTCPRSGKVLLNIPTLIPNSILKRLIADWSNKDSPKTPPVEGTKDEHRLWRSRMVKLHNFLKVMYRSDKDSNYYAILNIAKTMFECIYELKRMSKVLLRSSAASSQRKL